MRWINSIVVLLLGVLNPLNWRDSLFTTRLVVVWWCGYVILIVTGMSQSMVWKDITGFAFCWTVLLHLCAYTNSRQGESLGMMVMMWAYEYIFTILLVAIAIGNVFDDIYIVYVAGGIFILWWDIKVYRMRKNAH